MTFLEFWDHTEFFGSNFFGLLYFWATGSISNGGMVLAKGAVSARAELARCMRTTVAHLLWRKENDAGAWVLSAQVVVDIALRLPLLHDAGQCHLSNGQTAVSHGT
jgi:hypothetical protein